MMHTSGTTKLSAGIQLSEEMTETLTQIFNGT